MMSRMEKKCFHVYLVDQSPKIAAHLKNIWDHLISRVFEPFSYITSCFVSCPISATRDASFGGVMVMLDPGVHRQFFNALFAACLNL